MSEGFKGSYSPLVEWYSLAKRHLPTLRFILINEIQRNENVIQNTFNYFKYGMASGSEACVKVCIDFLKSLCESLQENSNMFEYIWEWFIGHNGGLNYCL